MAIKLNDEIIYLVPNKVGVPGAPPRPSIAYRGMEGTVAAPHAEGTEIEYVHANTAANGPNWSAEFKRAGRPPRPNGSVAHPWEDPDRQNWPNLGLPVSTRP